MNQKFTDIEASEFDNTEIVGSCFYQESEWDSDSLAVTPKNPNVDVFPANMTGVTFKRCNLDNCKIPTGNALGERNAHQKIRVMNDNEDWVLNDSDNKPLEPLNKKQFIQDGKSIDPKDIPAVKVVN